MRRHFGGDLLAHGAAQKIGLAHRIAGQLAGDAHDIFLIGHHAEGFVEDRLERGMEIIRLLLAALAGDVFGNGIHRARAIERHQRHQIVDVVGLHLAHQIAHARAFQLEHADTVAARQHLEGRGVVEIDGLGVELDAALLAAALPPWRSRSAS